MIVRDYLKQIIVPVWRPRSGESPMPLSAMDAKQKWALAHIVSSGRLDSARALELDPRNPKETRLLGPHVNPQSLVEILTPGQIQSLEPNGLGVRYVGKAIELTMQSRGEWRLHIWREPILSNGVFTVPTPEIRSIE